MKYLSTIVSIILISFTGAKIARAQVPEDWQLGFQEAATPVMERIVSFNDILFWMCVIISLFVFVLLGILIFKFNRKANPTPTKRSHNTVLEILWTVIPVVILVAIAVPSLRLLYYQDRAVDAEMTIKATGYQWYWSYEYPDIDAEFEITAVMIPEEELQEGQYRLLETDERVIVPVDTTIRMLVTADIEDVIHAWSVPAFGVKIDAIPGRVNETWFRATKEGVFYGQCSELCGAYHAFMPIAVEVVSKKEYAEWAEKAPEIYGEKIPETPANIALAEPR
ncbi:MAG: cytochrome c oxidase subunit II [Alphaproteobacteria bacterium]|nr:cytochrome c oxidase subunit II [Alphaproteobacteria bacterium]|tara:strand:- start:19540 stop:20379 length:840 start_codon:yes stop_codon:yes gene_type:complete